MTRPKSALTRPAPLLAALLVACGGGGGGTSDPATPTPNPPAPSLTRFSGVAATGAALAGAAVRVTCATGSASGTTAANGSYTLELSGAALPCVLSARSADGRTLLHSMADPQGGSPQVVQINPVTELMVAHLARTEPQAFVAGFDAAAQARLTRAAFDSAATAVVGMLKDAGVDLSALGNPVKAELVAASAGTPGNAYDQALDALAARLGQAGTSLAQVAASVAQAAAGQPTTSAASLPTAALLRPAHADCPAFRSGTYRMLSPSSNPANLVRTAQVDAPTATITWPNGDRSVATSTGGCSFRVAADRTRFVVSPAGVLVSVTADSAGTARMSIAVPDQAMTLADLQGDWNWAAFFEVNSPPTNLRAMDMGTVSVAASGQITALANCPMLAACTSAPAPLPAATLNAAGGFDLTRSSSSTTPRGFLYRPGNGDPLLVVVDELQIMVMAKARARDLPAVGDSWQRMDAFVNAQMQASDGFTFASYTVPAVDTSARTYIRKRKEDGAEQLFRMNHPRAGVAYRPAGSTATTSGTVNYNDLYVLALGGSGVYAYGRQTDVNQRQLGSFGFAVDVPAAAVGGVGSLR